jgi:hypothetical protein
MTPSPLFSTSTNMPQSSDPFFFVPLRVAPRALSTRAGTISGLSLGEMSASRPNPKSALAHLALLSPLFCTKANTASIPFSCATTFASRHHFRLHGFSNSSYSPEGIIETHRSCPSDRYGLKKGSVSEAVLPDFEITSLYADNLAFQFYESMYEHCYRELAVLISRHTLCWLRSTSGIWEKSSS